MMLERKGWSIIVLIFCTLGIVYYAIPELIVSPNDFMLVSEGDGLKSYYVFDYQLNYQKSFNHFSGLNYPYGDSYLFTDGFPALQAFLQFFPYLDSYHVGIIHFTLLIGFVLTSVFLFYILKYYTKSHWISVVGALCIFSLQPQFMRLFGHLSLSYACVIPMGWYLLIRFIHEPQKWKWASILLITNTIWFFTHGYLGLMLTVFSGIVLLFHYKIWKNLKGILQVFIAFFLPLILFFLISKWSNTVTDRTTEPFGFFEYQAQWKSIFLPSKGIFHDYLERFVSFKTVNWEGISYIGITSIISLFILLVFRGLSWIRKKPKTLVNKELWFYFIAGTILLFYSFGVPFNQFPSLLNIIEPIKQFRALGRFAWPFYFVCGVFSFVILHSIYESSKTKIQKISAVTLIAVGSFLYFWEASEMLLTDRSFSKNTLLIKYLNPEHQALIEFIQKNKSKYQCILPLPWFHIGSELYGKEPHLKTMSNSLITSAHTGLPLYSCMMGRTSFGQSYDFFRSLGSNFQEKNRSKLINEKDFLIWYDYEKLYAEDEQELFDLSKLVFKNKFGELRTISPNVIFTKKKIEASKVVVAGNYKADDFLFEKFDAKNNRLKAKASNFNTLAHFESGVLKPDSWYEVSFDYFWIGNKTLDNTFRIEFVKGKQVHWFYERTISSYTDQQKDKVRVRTIFKTQADSCVYNFFLFGGEKKQHEYEIDNLLIRPIGLDVKWQNDKLIDFVNSFELN